MNVLPLCQFQTHDTGLHHFSRKPLWLLRFRMTTNITIIIIIFYDVVDSNSVYKLKTNRQFSSDGRIICNFLVRVLERYCWKWIDLLTA